jgi:uncharacterized protein involved in outer membrane biogenesis
MKKLLKVVAFILVVVIIVALVGIVLVFLFADRAVQTAVEKAGTKTLRVPVEVAQAEVSLLAGSVELQDTRVANPPGYDGASLLTLQSVSVAADAGSLLTNEVVIKDMKLDNMKVFVEQKGTRNNLYEVIKPLREPRAPTGRKLIIDNLEIANILVHVDAAVVPGQPQSAEFEIAPIRMTDLGRDERMDTAVLISKVLLAVAAGVADQSGGILPAETIGEMTSILDKALDIGRIIFGPDKNTGDTRKDGDLGKTVTEGLKGIIDSPKKE